MMHSLVYLSFNLWEPLGEREFGKQSAAADWLTDVLGTSGSAYQFDDRRIVLSRIWRRWEGNLFDCGLPKVQDADSRTGWIVVGIGTWVPFVRRKSFHSNKQFLMVGTQNVLFWHT